jgi:peptidoglycan-associated lipoprotein
VIGFDKEDSMRLTLASATLLVLAIAVAGCHKKTAPVPASIQPPPAAANQPSGAAASQPTRVDDSLPVPPQPIADDAISNRSLDDLNRDSPLKPAFFLLDSADLDDAAKAVVNANADVLRKYSSWVVTIEGHCDERGTAEYNLALGERRAVAVKTYLASLGISPDRLRTVSYGKEFPFDPGHTEDSWSKNRRAQFVITAK